MQAAAQVALIAPDLKVSTEAWIALALLHREQPDRADFTISEIMDRVQREGLYPTVRPGIRTHVALHCVANRRSNPARLRMFYATSRESRRLYRPGDNVKEGRTGKMVPNKEDIPQAYRGLLEWYQDTYCSAAAEPTGSWLGGFFAVRGVFKDTWKDESPDDYVRRLRAGWN